MSQGRIVSDAIRQITGRGISAVAGFFVILLITPYLGELRYGDYTTVLSFFVICSSLSDYGLYVIAVREMGKHKDNPTKLRKLYGTYVGTRVFLVGVIYAVALLISFMIPAYRANPYIARGLPIAMLFSATFMLKGVMQLPLQIFWKMEQTSRGLILGRVLQIVSLLCVVYVLFPKSGEQVSLSMFLAVLGTVLISGLAERLYVWYQSHRLIPLSIRFDGSFIRDFLRTNAGYGRAYFMSSFHTYIVVFLLSLFYPTIAGFTHTSRRGLALQLMVILLIIPTFLGNSMLHHVAANTAGEKKKKYGGLLGLVVRVGLGVLGGLFFFAPFLVSFINPELLSQNGMRGSERILQGLGIVLFLSYIKQVFNYVLIGHGHERHIVWINLCGLLVGVSAGLLMIPSPGWRGGVVGGLIAQIILEIAFVVGGIIVARRYGCLPNIPRRTILLWTAILGFISLVYLYLGVHSFVYQGGKSVGLIVFYGLQFGLLYAGGTWLSMKRILRQMG